MKPMILAAPLAAFVLLAGCGGQAGETPTPTVEPTPETFDAIGTLTLPKGYGWEGGTSNCWGKGGFSDITQGAQVKVSDSSGDVIAFGGLMKGQYETGSGCVFGFMVVDVPDKGDGIYGIEISSRGVYQFKKADAEDLALKLGS